MARRSYGNVNCMKIYPVQDSAKQLSNLKTVAFVLSANQAIELATNLLSAARNSNQIDVTGFRARGLISVTSASSIEPKTARRVRKSEISI